MTRLRACLPTMVKLTHEEEALRVQEFWETLKQFSIEQVERAVNQAIRELRFFPSPRELIDLCCEEVEIIYTEKQNVPLIEQRTMTAPEAKAALQKIFDRVEYGSKMTEQEIQSDKQKVSERKAFLKKQLRELEIK